MPPSIYYDAANLILLSMFKKSDSGFFSDFMILRPGEHPAFAKFGATVYYHRRELVRAILFIRKNGSNYLKYLSVGDIWDIVTDFVMSNYWTIYNETMFVDFDGPYASFLSENAKNVFAQALSQSRLFSPTNTLTIFPLSSLHVVKSFDCNKFFFTKADKKLGQERLPENVMEEWIIGDRFPPESDFKGRVEIPQSWLGIRSPDYRVSEKIKTAILGALALTQNDRVRRRCSDRHSFGGYANIGTSMTCAFGQPHMPPLMHDIRITNDDSGWLSIISDILSSNSKQHRRYVKALEYYYRSWFLSEPERFPILCMALDGVFGDENHATRSVIDAIRTTIGAHIQDTRLRSLMEIRASVIHGGAPDVYDSRKYATYYDEYGVDPIRDLDIILAQCLRNEIFGDAMTEHPHPEAELIAKLRGQGRIPLHSDDPSILDAVG